MFNCRRKSFEYLNSPKIQFVESRELSDLFSKVYEKSLKVSVYPKIDQFEEKYVRAF